MVWRRIGAIEFVSASRKAGIAPGGIAPILGAELTLTGGQWKVSKQLKD
jgi:hypothetical protein